MNTSTTTQAANSGSTDQALCLLVPELAHDMRLFWAVCAVNDGTLHQVYLRFMDDQISKESTLVQRSLFAAENGLRMEKNRSFQEARKSGVLLFAWYGSSALVAAQAQAGERA